MSKKKTKSSSQSTGTATTTPNVPSWISGPYQQYLGQVGSMIGGAPGGASPLQSQAFSGASRLGAIPGLSDAMGATRGLLNFTPDNVTAGQLSETDLSPYMNPYTNEVIDRSLGDLDRARQMAIGNTQGAATQAKAYGGSRHGVADSLTNREFADSSGNLAASLRQAGFNTALGGAQFDIGNRLQAGLANQQAGLQGAGFRLGAAEQLGRQGAMEADNTRANIGTQAALGERERELTDPVQSRLNHLRQLAQLLGISPEAFIGQTINQSGQSSGTQTQSPGFNIGFQWGPFSAGYGT